MLDAFLDLTAQKPFDKWRLVIAGDGESGYVERIRDLVRNRGGAVRVVFAGWLYGQKNSVR